MQARARRSSASVSPRASLLERRGRSLRQDSQVGQDRRAARIAAVELDPLDPVRVAAAEHLPRAGDSRRRALPNPLVGGKRGCLESAEWARANEAHVAFENVVELRQFVEARAPQPIADARNPRIAWCLECTYDVVDRAAAAPDLTSELHVAFVGVRDHCTELDHVERRAPAADPALPIED